jgi:hypothetical protein
MNSVSLWFLTRSLALWLALLSHTPYPVSIAVLMLPVQCVPSLSFCHLPCSQLTSLPSSLICVDTAATWGVPSLCFSASSQCSSVPREEWTSEKWEPQIPIQCQSYRIPSGLAPPADSSSPLLTPSACPQAPWPFLKSHPPWALVIAFLSLVLSDCLAPFTRHPVLYWDVPFFSSQEGCLSLPPNSLSSHGFSVGSSTSWYADISFIFHICPEKNPYSIKFYTKIIGIMIKNI